MINTKKIFFFLIFIINCLSFTYAQDTLNKETVYFGDVGEVEEKEVKHKHTTVYINGNSWHNNSNFRIGLLDIGFSSYLFDGSFSLPAEVDDFELNYTGSFNFNWHIFRHRLPVVRNDLSIEYGLSFNFNRYKFTNNIRFIEDQIPLEWIVDEEIDFDKNKLKTSFLEVPLMLTFTPGRRKSVYLSGGGFAGILLNAKQKIKIENGEKIKIKDDFNLNKFRYGIVGRIGLGPIAFYAQYALNDLFKTEQGPSLTPINLGITVLNF